MQIHSKILNTAPVVRRNFEKHPWIAVASVFLFALAIHAPFVLYDCFGEQDAARLAIRAVYGDLTGHLKMGGQWPFSYPLYIHLLYGLLRWDLPAYASLPLIMSLLSLFSSALFSALFCIFVFRSVHSMKTAIAATTALQFAPVFFLNSIYGFPTITALTLFIAAAVSLQQGMCFATGNSRAVAALVTAAACFTIGVLFKVDVLLGAALFLLPVYQSTKSPLEKAGFACGVVVTCLGAFWLLNRYGLALSKATSAGAGWENWSRNFFSGPTALFSENNIVVISRAAGILSMPAALVSFIWCMATKQHRIVSVGILLTMTPIALFWGVMDGNSARHNLIPAVFAPFLAALPLAGRKSRIQIGWGFALLFTLLFNYFCLPPSADTVKPSGRLIRSAALLKEKCTKYRRFGREIAATQKDRVFVVAPAHVMPFYQFETMSALDLTFVKSGNIHLYMKRGNRKIDFVFPLSDQEALRTEYKEKGYTILSAPR